MTKNVERAPWARSSATISSKRQFGSLRRSLCSGTRASPRASCSAGPTRPPRAWPLRRAAAPSIPILVHFQGRSTSCVSATAKRASLYCGAGSPRSRRSRSSGGSSGSRLEEDAKKRPCRSRGAPCSSIRARWKNAAASTSPFGSSPRSTCSQAAWSYSRSAPSRRFPPPSVSRTHRARCSTRSGIRTAADIAGILRTLAHVSSDSPGKPQSLGAQLRGLTRDSFIYGIGGLVSRFLAVLLLPLYTSYVSPGDHGRIEILTSAMAVAVVVLRGGANFGFIRFYFLEKDAEYRRRLVRTVFWAQMAYSTLALVLCIVLA